MIVVADSGPLRYLILIEQAELLPPLHGRIVIPTGVLGELTHASTPPGVRVWMEDLPDWITVKSPAKPLTDCSALLGPGESEAIALAQELTADALLIDDQAARAEARKRNIAVQGTLGVLDLAAEHGFLANLPSTIARLRNTNFRASEKLLKFFLERDSVRKKSKLGG